MHKSKKIIGAVAALTLAFSSLALAGCGSKGYKGDELTVKDGSAVVESTNGGFVVETGDFVYFINGVETNTADNTYGKVEKGSLMRIAKTELSAGNYAAAQIVVPSLFVAGNYDAGIYIYDGYVYYATPTTDKNNAGQVENSYLDFKRAKLDGSTSPMDGKNEYFLRLSSNTTKYRFVKEKDTVYCLFEEDSKLKSYNVSTGKTTVLVSGASSFFYNTEDKTDGNVYYTMSVTYDLDKKNTNAQSYNQIYCVNAATTATVDSAKASYKAINDGKEVASYDFDEKFMKDNADEKGYNLNDYTTYPYVNLGSLVLDGVGSYVGEANDTRFTLGDRAQASTAYGYTYTIQAQGNEGLYFTRAEVGGTSNDASYLYYIPNAKAEGWDTVTGNKSVATVAIDTTAASATALYEINEGKHSYIYLSDSIIKKATVDEQGKATEIINLADGVSGVTLWKTEGDYLYYYGTGTNGKNISRINYKGEEDAYNDLLATDEYKPQTLALVDFNDSWYKPEFVTAGEKQLVFYANAQSFGSGGTSYNYIYAAPLGTTAEIVAANEAVEAVNEYIDEYSDNSEAQAVMKYYFRTGKTAAYDEVKGEYDEKTQQKYISEFIAEFEKENGLKLEKSFISLVGRMNEADEEAIEEDWANSLLKEEETDDTNGGLETWAIVLIVCGAVLVAAVIVVSVVVSASKKKAKKAREEAIVSAYKRKKIDTTDDKSIDVYADEKVEEPVSEEVVNEVEEAPVVDETVVEETPVEAAEQADEEPSTEE